MTHSPTEATEAPAPPPIEQLEKMADWLDSRFTLPGTSIRFGLDSLLGLVPGVGDTVTAVASAYLIGRARRHNVPFPVLALMIINAGLDWLIGLIPFIGDIFDIGWKANRKNIALLKKHASVSADHTHAHALESDGPAEESA